MRKFYICTYAPVKLEKIEVVVSFVLCNEVVRKQGGRVERILRPIRKLIGSTKS